jgi:hypothetical protein
VWRRAEDGTGRAVESRVESRHIVIHEETTTTIAGSTGVAVAESNLPLTKAQIRDRLRQKYIAEQEINKREYDENPPYDCLSDPEEEEMMKSIGQFEYTDHSIFGNEHPIELATYHNLSFIDAFPVMELQSLQGRWVCPLSNQAREWRRTNSVSDVIVSDVINAHCGGNCNTDYDSRQSLEKHLRKRGKNEIMHKYTLEFMEEWAKQH